MWQSPFRVAEKINESSVKLQVAGTSYQLFPIVHLYTVPIVHTSILKLVQEFSDRPQVELVAPRLERIAFDEALLPEGSWNEDLAEGEYEVEKITDMRTGRKTKYGRVLREFQVHRRGYDEPTWVDEANRNCGALLHGFLMDRSSRNRLGVMHSAMSSLTTTTAQESASVDSATSVPASAGTYVPEQASTSTTESTLSVDEHHALQYKKRVKDKAAAPETILEGSSVWSTDGSMPTDYGSDISDVPMEDGEVPSSAADSESAAVAHEAVTWSRRPREDDPSARVTKKKKRRQRQ
ncbi:hypothetical protein PI125_g12356 [Phytophthora idaei]|nr:hypothetical protein PI125_g12356 [Phytophthora idaei]KAG3147742.1 hypothetical protein PI126_g12754 [Phytophthora idaei]